jgi:hypothetical protein
MRAVRAIVPGFSILPLLIHSHAVPPSARSALQAAQAISAPQERAAALATAAHVLHQETGLECRDVLEIVGLEPDSAC